MSDSLILLLPLVVLAIVLLFPFIGCLGDDPVPQLKKDLKEAQDKAADLEEQLEREKQKPLPPPPPDKYDEIVLAERDLVSYWKLDEPDAGKTVVADGRTITPAAMDSAPDQPRHGEYKLATGLSFAQKGALSKRHATNTAVGFDGTQGYVEVAHHMLLNPPEDFSVELWLQPEEDGSAPQVLVGSYDIDSTGALLSGYMLEWVPGTPSSVRGTVGHEDGATSVTAPLFASENEGWHHVVFTCSGVDQRLRLYVNAVNANYDAEVSPATGMEVTYAANQNSNAPLRIGAGRATDPAAAAAVAGAFFKGRIDEVALYRVELDGAAVQAHYLAALKV